MQRYFFHVYDGEDHFDDNGSECESIQAVRVRMLNIAMDEVMKNTDPTKNDLWSIEAFDERGSIVGSMDFGLLSSTETWRKNG